MEQSSSASKVAHAANMGFGVIGAGRCNLHQQLSRPEIG